MEGVETLEVFVALTRKRADGDCGFVAEDVIGARGFGQIGRGFGAPAVGFRAEVGDFGGGLRRAHESGHIRGKGFGCGLIYEAMAAIGPG
jgi:hypothetical protein